MLRSTGVRRTFTHNLLLAVFFAFIAGIINVFGLINLGVFTTNITGHVGELALSVETMRWQESKKVILWIFAFGFGSFTSAVLVNYLQDKMIQLSYALPIGIEIGLLIACFVLNKTPENQAIQILILLYTMGLQNGIVSVVSGKVVRTTHLTGMVTDVGIGLGKLVLKKGNQIFVRRSLLLNISIIIMFVTGGIIGTLITYKYQEKVLLIPIILLISILLYDLKVIEKHGEKTSDRFKK